MIKVLITEDSPVVRGYLKYILSADSEIEVVGTAKDGEEAVKMVETNRPDVITMDIHMPKMDGFEATRKIMETNPVPVVIVSASWNPEEVDKTFRTMEAGAVAALEKPMGMGHPNSEASVRELVQTVKLMSEVKVVRRWARLRKVKPDVPPKTVEESKPIKKKDVRIVAVGASTGGPLVLQAILSGLPKAFPVPIVIVQHIAPGFLAGLADWLSRTSGFSVHIAEQGMRLLPGNAYLAPDGFQISVTKQLRSTLTKDKKACSLCPSVAHLFNSVAETFQENAVGILLTGMGKDGAKELKLMKERGAVTIAQNKESSIVHGMPGEAIKIGAAEYILSSNSIASKLQQFINTKEVVKNTVNV
jgi:two-component system chemotaxis response regulator CheB